MSLPIPTGRQPYVIYLPSRGHQVVLGTAGTGKTTMAMLRAAHLASPSTPGHGPVLLVTYNNALVTYLRHLDPDMAGKVTIETYHRFARGYLNSRGLMPRFNGVAQGRGRRSFVEAAIREVSAHYRPHAIFDRPVDFFVDEIDWICGMGIVTLDEYKRTRRTGRQIGIKDNLKTVTWDVLTAYRERRDAAGFRYDWYDLASAALTELERDNRPRLYRHIVIDEGQDLAPEAIRSLATAMDPQGSLTFFGDYHQQIYGQGVSWRACGLSVRRIERFADNYRNSPEIARLAIAMSEMPHMAGDREDLVVPTRPDASGALPTLARCRDEAEEIEIVVRQARDLAQSGNVAVLARTWEEARRSCRGLRVRKLTPEMTAWDTSPGVFCGSYHSAKGLEFDAVILPFCGTGHTPHPDVVSAFGTNDAMAREGKLLYVGVTRAKSELLITYSGSVLTPLLPASSGLYAEVTP